MKKYKVIALIGESGTGKDSILNKLIHEIPEAHRVVSHTSRPVREGETDGKDYHFVSASNFVGKISRNEMIESTRFNNWYYGISIKSLEKDKINLCVLNPTGIRNLLNRDDIELKVYRIQASDKTRLIRQLTREENPNVEEIIRRYKTDKIDFEDLEFDFQSLKNENLEDFTIAANTIISEINLN